MLKKIIIAFLLIVCVVFLAGITVFIIKLIPPHIDRDKIDDAAYRREAEEHLYEKYQTEFDILEQTGSNDEYVIVEYYASPKDNPDIVFTVRSGYTDHTIGFIPPFWRKYTADDFAKGISNYVVEQYIKENPISILRKTQFQKVKRNVLDLIEKVSKALRAYNAEDSRLFFPITILGNNVIMGVSLNDSYINAFMYELDLEYEKQLAINSGDPAYDYEFEYAGTDYYYINVEMIDDDNIHIELLCDHDELTILTGYKEYRKSGEFAYLYIKSAQDESGAHKEMRYLAFDYNVSGLKEVYVCDGDGRTYLIWSRESDDLTE